MTLTNTYKFKSKSRKYGFIFQIIFEFIKYPSPAGLRSNEIWIAFISNKIGYCLRRFSLKFHILKFPIIKITDKIYLLVIICR